MLDIELLKEYIIENTMESVENDQFNHQEDAYFNGVDDAIEAMAKWFDINES